MRQAEKITRRNVRGAGYRDDCLHGGKSVSTHASLQHTSRIEMLGVEINRGQARLSGAR